MKTFIVYGLSETGRIKLGTVKALSRKIAVKRLISKGSILDTKKGSLYQRFVLEEV